VIPACRLAGLGKGLSRLKQKAWEVPGKKIPEMGGGYYAEGGINLEKKGGEGNVASEKAEGG